MRVLVCEGEVYVCACGGVYVCAVCVCICAGVGGVCVTGVCVRSVCMHVQCVCTWAVCRVMDGWEAGTYFICLFMHLLWVIRVV